jgi:hypothetical protein
MASAFTAKATSVEPCRDLIRQGRCTLVTMLQVGPVGGASSLSRSMPVGCMGTRARCAWAGTRRLRALTEPTHAPGVIQMYKILGVNCLCTAYILSVQNLQGVKQGDVQVRPPLVTLSLRKHWQG